MKKLSSYPNDFSILEDIQLLWVFKHRENPLPQDLVLVPSPALFVGDNRTQGVGRIRIECENTVITASLENRNPMTRGDVWELNDSFSLPKSNTILDFFDALVDRCFFEALYFDLIEGPFQIGTQLRITRSDLAHVRKGDIVIVKSYDPKYHRWMCRYGNRAEQTCYFYPNEFEFLSPARHG